MRKNLISALILICSLYLVACSANGSNADTNELGYPKFSEDSETQETEMNVGSEVATDNQNGEYSEPPHMLLFDSYDQVIELRNLMNESDEEVVLQYLIAHNYEMNGLSSKEDIANFFDKIGEMEIPYFEADSEWTFGAMLYEVESEELMITYCDGEQKTRFYCYLEEPDDFAKENSKHGEKEFIVNAGKHKVDMYSVADDDNSHGVIGKFQTSNSYISIKFEGENNINEDIKIAPLKEILEMRDK